MEKFKYNGHTRTLVGYTLEGAVRGISDILNVNVDYSKSLFNPRVSKIVTDTLTIKNLRWCQTLRKLVELGGGGVLAEGDSIARVGGNRGKYIVKLGEVIPVTTFVDTTEPAESPEIVVETPAEIIQEEVSVVVESSEEESSVTIPDFDYAEALYTEDDEKGSRKKLDLYAEGFGVKLNGRKKFSNMMEDFKNEYK